MKFIKGGDIFMHLWSAINYRFDEDRVKFYALSMAMALGHLHS
jgi:hypothetical protein